MADAKLLFAPLETNVAETRAAIRQDRRWLMFIFEDPATGRMNIRSIPDRTAPAKPEAPAAPATPPAPNP